MHLILQFRFFIFKTDVDTYSSSFFRHQIHCGHLFLLQNVKIKQFVNFSLRVGGRLLKYLYGLKMCVMSMFFLLIYNKRQTLMLVDYLSTSMSHWCPCFSIIDRAIMGQ